MNVVNSALLGSTAVLLAVATVPSANANLLSNPGFSAPTVPARLSGSNVTSWSYGGTPSDFSFVCATPAGACSFDSVGGLISLTVPSTFGAPAPGPNWIAMDGDPAFRGTGLQQTVSGLVTGDTYTLSFDFGSAQEVGVTGVTTEQIEATLGDQSFFTNVLTTPSQGFNPFQLENFTFTYNGAGNLLTFLAIGSPGGAPPYSLIANPSLTGTGPSVPEPASVTLLLSGMAGLGWLRRRRARKT